MSLSQDIKHKTIELGFDLVGITDASPIDTEQAELFTDWLESGFAGQMSYMHRNIEKRLNPGKILENAQSIITVALSYTPPVDTHLKAAQPTGRVADYAQFEDYHPFMKERLRRLVEFMISHVDAGFKFKICVDSAPVAERALAVRAGLGFIGRNHMLINPQLGCQIFLGEIITDLKLEPDACATKNMLHTLRKKGKKGVRSLLLGRGKIQHGQPSCPSYNCGGCTKCISACPTGALRADGRFDAGRCINYLTIEHKGPIQPEFAEKIGDHVFGCDECVFVCPYQKKAKACRNSQLKFYEDRTRLNLQEVLDLTDETFAARFTGSPIERTCLDGLKRNAEICLANLKGQP
jgi:epoxyqueuosine reductase